MPRLTEVAVSAPVLRSLGAERQPSLEVLLEPAREAIRVIVVGELDLATVPTLHDQLVDVVDTGFKHVILDLRRLEFIDSTGLHEIVASHNCARRDGWELTIIQGPPAVRRVFELTATLDLLPFVTPGELLSSVCE
jgi:anti-sigma B factor antagonist